jgi:c-di-GMP-binding flagellar brake protein YcgR
MNATAEDLSVGGIFLRSQHFAAGEVHELGQLVTLQFDAGNRRVVQGVGKVVRVVRPGHGVIAGVALEFVEIDETSQRLVAAIVDIKLAQPHGS